MNTFYETMLVYDTNLELQEKANDNQYAQQVNKAQSFNAIKHKAFDIFCSSKSLAKQMKQLEDCGRFGLGLMALGARQ